jgi:hypothetical protein
LANTAWVIGDLDAALSPFYIASYVLPHAGMVLIACTTARRRWRTGLALDGALAGLTAAAMLTSFIKACHAVLADGRPNDDLRTGEFDPRVVEALALSAVAATSTS